MARIPITVMGYRCERCEHEWIPKDYIEEPAVCPECNSPHWNRPRQSNFTYEEFRAKVADTLHAKGGPLTWTEIRTRAKLPQKFPNNQWIRQMEEDIKLVLSKDAQGIIQWRLE